jgi:hypothetical protein
VRDGALCCIADRVDDPARIGFAHGKNQFSRTERKKNCSAIQYGRQPPPTF